MKKLIVNLVISVLLVNVFVIAGAVNAESAKNSTLTFSDTKGHWAEPQIQKAISAGFVTGYADGTFKPDATITGQEFLAMIVKALQYPVETATMGGSWFAPYKQAITSHKLYNNDYSSKLDNPITRGEVAKTIVRATQETVYNALVKEEMTKRFSSESTAYRAYTVDKDTQKIESSPYFQGELILDSDNPDIAINQLNQLLMDIPDPKDSTNWTKSDFDNLEVSLAAKNVLEFIEVGLAPIIQLSDSQLQPQRMVYEATSRGLLTGTGTGELSLDSKVTRAQAVTFVNRVVAFNRGERFETDKKTVATAELLWHHTNLVTALPKYFGKPWASDDYIDASELVSKSKDGVTVCSVRQYVVIDLDDANDPNRSLLSQYQLGWYDAVGTTFELNATKNAYAFIGIYDSKINGKFTPNAGKNYVSCSISIGNDYLDSVMSRNTSKSASNPDGAYFVSEFKANSDHKDYPSLANFPDVSKYVSGGVTSGTITTISGVLIDKDYLKNIPTGQRINLSLSPITNDNVTGIYSTTVQ